MKSLRGWLKEDFGAVLFAPQRRDVRNPPEPNTPDEERVFDAFQKHYFGGRDTALVKELPRLLKAMNSGKHSEFLRVPKQYKYAYRLMADLPAATLKSVFNIPVSGDRGIARGGTYTNTRNVLSSWTVDYAVLPKIVDDFGGKLYRKNADSYHVLVIADLDRSRNAFIMNPDKYYDIPSMAGQFSYQREIISHKPVKLLKTIFCNKNQFGGDDRMIVQWLMDGVSL